MESGLLSSRTCDGNHAGSTLRAGAARWLRRHPAPAGGAAAPRFLPRRLLAAPGPRSPERVGALGEEGSEWSR